MAYPAKTWMSFIFLCAFSATGCLQADRPQAKSFAGFEPIPPVKSASLPQSPRVTRSQQPDLPTPPRNGYQLPTPPSQKNLVKQTSNSLPAPEANRLRLQIAAWVNGKPILQSEVMTNASPLLVRIARMDEPRQSIERKKILEKTLKALIDQEVIFQDAYGKLKKNPVFLKKLKEMAGKEFQKKLRVMQKMNNLSPYELKEVLDRQGISLKSMRRQEEKDFIVMEYMRSRVSAPAQLIGHQDLYDYYVSHPEEFQTEDRVEWEDIFIAIGGKYPTREKAYEMARKVAAWMQAGYGIDRLLQFDEGDSSTRNGRGFGERRGDIKPPQLEPYLFKLKPGQVGPLVELSTGIHVFRVIKRDYAGKQPFNEETQRKVMIKLRNRLAKQEYQRIVRELSSRAVIEVDPNVLQ